METTTRVKYATVNGAWPEGTRDGRDLKPTPQEAVAAARRLYRFGMKKAFAGDVKLTSGRRFTWTRRGTLYVNPDMNGGGWHELVHCMSHLCTRKLYPTAKPHSGQHAFIEKQMINHVVQSGWLEGKLTRPEKSGVVKGDPRVQKLARVESRIKSWNTKKKRAETALQKLDRQRKYYTRVLGEESIKQGHGTGFDYLPCLPHDGTT